MTTRQFEGEYIHAHSKTLLRYVCRYEFKPIGVVYEANAGFGGKSKRLVQGVITWGIRAFPPRRRVEAAVRETIDILDIEKFRAALNQA